MSCGVYHDTHIKYHIEDIPKVSSIWHHTQESLIPIASRVKLEPNPIIHKFCLCITLPWGSIQKSLRGIVPNSRVNLHKSLYGE